MFRLLHIAVCLFFFGWLPIAMASSHIDPRVAIKKATKFFEQGKCHEVIRILLPLASEQLEDDTQYIETYKLLALCYYQQGKNDRGKNELQNLLFLRPDYTFDAFSTPPIIISELATIKSQMAIKQKEVDAAKDAISKASPQSPPPEPVIKIVERDIIYRKTSPLTSFVPFGIGQMENGDIVKGSIIAAAEIVFIGLNIGAYWWKRSLLDPTNIGTVNNSAVHHQFNVAQGIQFASLGSALAVYVYGTIDALLNRKAILEKGK